MTDDFLSISERKKLYDQGDKTQILGCLWWCLATHKPIPPWLEQAFKNAYYAKRAYKIKSWDEVFGRPVEKHARPAKELRNKKIAKGIVARVEERHRAGEPIDKELFKSVGKDFGVGGTVASQLYYEMKKVAKELDDFLGWESNFLKDLKKPGSFRED